jgi:kynurenine/2-aminoadipate aminotransferase
MVAGMFLWLRLTHVRDSRALIQEKARERKVLLVPGADFSSEEGAVSSCVRASFSTASAVDMEEAVSEGGERRDSAVSCGMRDKCND